MHWFLVKLLGTGIQNWNPDCPSTSLQSYELYTMLSSLTGTFEYKAEHLVTTSNILRKSINISLHCLISICDSSRYLTWPLSVYFVLWQILEHLTCSLISWEEDWHLNLLVRVLIIFSILSCVLATCALVITIPRNFLPSMLHVPGKPRLHNLFNFWTYTNSFVFLIFILLFSAPA